MDGKTATAQEGLRREARGRGEGSTKRELLRLLLKLGIIAAAVAIAWIFLVGAYVNYGNNMYPAIRDGDLCIVWRPGAPRVGDVVSYKQDGVRRFGRVVATPGHVVDITNEGLLVDGSVQYEEVVYATTAEFATVRLPMKLEEGEVFILNDFREDFSDSRQAGAYPIDELDGRVIAILRRRGI